MKEFSPFRLDTVNQCLWRGRGRADEERILLTPKAFALLRYLVEHPGRLVTHDELLDALWPKVEHLLAKAPGSPLPTGLAELIYQHSEGNPLFMVAALAHMIERGLVARERAGWQLRVPLTEVDLSVPENLRHMIEAPIERLGHVFTNGTFAFPLQTRTRAHANRVAERVSDSGTRPSGCHSRGPPTWYSCTVRSLGTRSPQLLVAGTGFEPATFGL